MIDWLQEHWETIVVLPPALFIAWVWTQKPTHLERKAERQYLAQQRTRRIHGGRSRRRGGSNTGF